MSSLGDLVVSVGGDVSGFDNAVASVDAGLTNISSKAASAADTFDNTFLKSIGIASDTLSETAAGFAAAANAMDPFVSAAHQVGEAISAALPPAFQFSEAAQEIIDKQSGLNAAAQESIAAFQEISAAYKQGAASAEDVARAETQMHDALAAVKPAANDAESGFMGLGESLEKLAGLFGIGLGIAEGIESLKAFAEESIDAYGKIQLATVALTALTGSSESASKTLEAMKGLALNSIFDLPSLDQAAQKMAAIGVAAASIPPAMKAVVDAAEGTGNSMDNVASSLDRIYLSATIMPRTLASLGISIKDLAETMGISADQVKAAFQAMGPQSDDALQILTATIERRMGSAGDAVKGTLPNAINSVKVQWDILLEDFGEQAAGPFTTALNHISSLTSAVDALFKSMSGSGSESKGSTLMSIIGDFTVATAVGTIAKLAEGVGVLTGKYGSMAEAAAAVNAQVDLGTKSQIDQDAALASSIVAEADQADKTQASAQAARDKLAATQQLALEEKLRTKATQEISEAENTLAASTRSSYIPVVTDLGDAEAALENARANRASAASALAEAEARLIAVTAPGQHDTVAMADAEQQLTLARQALKDQDLALSEREKDLTVSKTVSKDASNLLAAAEKESAEAMKSVAEPIILSYGEALEAVSIAKQKVIADQAVLSDAEETYWGLVNSTGVKDEKELADAAGFVSAAYKQQATDAVAVKASEQTLNTIRTDGIKTSKSLLDGNTALELSYTKFSPTIKDLGSQLQGIHDDEVALTQAQSDEYDALSNLQAAKDAGLTQGQYVDDQLAKEKLARDAVSQASKTLSAAIQQLSKDYGISYAAAKLLADSQNVAVKSEQLLADAYLEAGVQTESSLQALADAATIAYNAIASDANASVIQQTDALGKLITAYQNAGDAVPASLQIAYAKGSQITQDFIAGQVRLWTDLSNAIHGDIQGMFSGLITDLFTGGDFVKTMEDTLKKIGESIVSTIFKPFTDLISQTIAKALTNWVKDALGTIIPGLSGVLGTGLGATATTANTTAVTANTAAVTALTAAISAAAGTSAATAGVDAGAQAASGAASAGSSAAGGAASGAGGFLGIFNAVTGAISAVTGILQLFGVGQGGQKDRLNGIDNNTADLDLVFRQSGGILELTWDIRNNIVNLTDAFTHWFRDNISGINDDLDSLNQRFQIFAERTFPDFAKGFSGTAIVPSATPASAVSLGNTSVSLKGNVYLDGKEIFGSFVQWAEDNGLVVPQS